MPEMKSLTLNDKTYDCFVDSVARSQVKATAVVVAREIGDISTALDGIIAIQEELIGIKTITVYIDDGEFTAVEGMTWAEWCESDYNTIGAYINDYGRVALGEYTLIVFLDDTTEQVDSSDVIDPKRTYESC